MEISNKSFSNDGRFVLPPFPVYGSGAAGFALPELFLRKNKFDFSALESPQPNNGLSLSKAVSSTLFLSVQPDTSVWETDVVGLGVFLVKQDFRELLFSVKCDVAGNAYLHDQTYYHARRHSAAGKRIDRASLPLQNGTAKNLTAPRIFAGMAYLAFAGIRLQ